MYPIVGSKEFTVCKVSCIEDNLRIGNFNEKTCTGIVVNAVLVVDSYRGNIYTLNVVFFIDGLIGVLAKAGVKMSGDEEYVFVA